MLPSAYAIRPPLLGRMRHGRGGSLCSRYKTGLSGLTGLRSETYSHLHTHTDQASRGRVWVCSFATMPIRLGLRFLTL
jgi:hypothetical protein